MTTAKAMLVNTADQYNWTGGGPNADLTRVRQGWGMPDLRNMYDQAVEGTIFVIDETDVIRMGSSASYDMRVPPGPDDEFKVTMKALKKFVESSNHHAPFLLRKAQKIEEYLGQR